jgi:hypothetical protein
VHNVGDLAFLIVVETLALGFVVLGVLRGTFRRYLYLYLYTAGILACDAVRALALRSYGLRSNEYFFAYFGSDFCLVVLKYLAIISIFEIILRESPLRTQARLAFLVLFGLVAAMSYGFTSHLLISKETLFLKRLTVELQQNMYFASVVLTALMCLTLAHLRQNEPQLRALVSGLGMSGALQACGWAVQNLVSKDHFHALWGVIRYVPPAATMTMLAVWCYALTSLPLSTADCGDSLQGEREESLVLSPVLTRAEVRG